MKEDYNYNGEKILDRIYKDLYLSKEVSHTKKKSDTKYESIKKYLDRLEKIHKNAKTKNQQQILKNLYFNKYIIKNFPKNINEYKKELIIKNQKESLEKWIEYLEKTDCPIWIKYWIFQGMIKMGTYNYEKEVYFNRNDKTTSKFVDANEEILNKIVTLMKDNTIDKKMTQKEIKMIIENINFSKIYTNLEKKYKNNFKNNGIWIKYEEKNEQDLEKLVKSLEGKNTGWCTAQKEYAKNQIYGLNGYNSGDFYIYFTIDKENKYTNPRIVIKLNGKNKIEEIRGIEKNQNIEESLIEELEKKIKELENINKEDIQEALEKINDLKKLKEIYIKTKQNIQITEEELTNLYTKKYGFGFKNDPLIEKIIKNRNLKKDYDNINDEYKHIILNINKNILEQELKDKKFILETINQKDKDLVDAILKNMDDSLKEDEQFIKELVEINYKFFKYASSTLKKKIKFIEEMIEIDGRIIGNIDEKLKDDDKLITKALQNNGKALASLKLKYKDEEKYVLIAIKQNPIAFINASQRLQNDKRIVIEALNQSKKIIIFVNNSLKEDEEIKKILEKNKKTNI